MAATRLFHLFLAVSDLNRSIEFYTKAFEGAHMLYEFTIDGLNLRMFSLGNGIVLELLEKPDIDKQDGKWEHIALECDDIDAQYQRLIAAGATVKMPLEHTTVLKGRNGYPDTECCGVHVWGPDHEEIELCQHRGHWGWEQPNSAGLPYQGAEQ